MKNDHCRKSLPPGVNKFFQKGPLRPEKSKKQKRASEEKSHKMKNDPCWKLLPPLFCFLLFSGLRGPLRKNLFTRGGNDFRQGSFFINDFFLLRPFFVFCCFWASEALFGKIYLLEVVTIFNKDHFLFYDFFCPRLLRPFCFFRASEALFRQTYLLRVVTIFDKDHFSFYVFFCPPRKNLLKAYINPVSQNLSNQHQKKGLGQPKLGLGQEKPWSIMSELCQDTSLYPRSSATIRTMWGFFWAITAFEKRRKEMKNCIDINSIVVYIAVVSLF